MEYLQAALLGIIQGISEFLPISSSGHLVLAESLFGIGTEGITFEVVVHFGTLCSILIYYRAMLLRLGRGLLAQFMPGAFGGNGGDGLSGSATSGQGEGGERWNEDTRLVGYILLSMIPAMVVGFLLKDRVEALFDEPFVVSILLIVTGTLLFSTRFIPVTDGKMNAKRAILMGVAQAFAVLPGISRAGSTITMGILLRTDRNEAATFSFLMVLPVIAGAMLLEVIDLVAMGPGQVPFGILLVGFLSSFVSGYLALGSLIALLRKRRFYAFAYYCWAVGLLGVVWFI